MAHSDADTPPPSTRRGPRLKKPPSATNLHAAAAAAPPSRRDVPSHSHSHLLIPQHDPVPEMRLEKGKRKRMKKTRDDEDWMPAPPPPAPSTAAAYHRPGSAPAHSNTNAPGGLNATMMMEDVAMMHGGSGSGSGRHDTSPRQHQQMFTPALPTHVYDPTAASGSVFEEHPPVPIQSFAESERTKRQKNGVNGGGRSSSGSGASGGGGGNGQGPTSVLDLFFTDAKSKLPYPTQLITPTNERSLKRKRRQDRDGRRSRQRGGDTASDEAAFEYDMLRFGVDSVKLVPQGLVDRVDGKMSRDFIARVIVGHVDSWTRRSGFGNNFLQEITTLLTAYYPCSYPTILDEVLVAFIFRRPEFTETLLRPMVDKMLKTGDSATSARYPVIEAFARKCALETAGGSERQRHHFACLTVLRYLVERNIDKFVLSPWIVLCALECSDAVLTDLWCALLDACVGSPVARTPQCGGPDLQWHVFDPMQHVYELIREEKSCLKAGVNARLSAALLRRVLLASDHQTLVDADFVRVALEQFVTNCDRRTSSQLFQEWRVQAGQGKSKEVAAKWVAFLRPFAHVLGKLPAHRSRWLVSHVLHYLLTAVAEPEELVHALIRDYGTLMFKEGSEAPDDTAEVNGNKEHTDAVVSARIGADVVAENTVYLLEEIHEQDKAVVVVDGWRSVWIEDATKGHLSWNCVQAMVLVIATKDVDALCGSALAGKFGALVQDVCSARFSRREELESGRASGIREAVRVLLPSTRPLAGKLLFEVLSAVCACPSKSAPTGGASDMTLGNALLYCLTESSRGALSANEKAIVQKPVVEYNTTHRLTSGTDMQVLRALGELARASGEIGAFVRRQLSAKSTVRLLSSMLGGDSDTQVALLLELVNAIVSDSKGLAVHAEWMRSCVLHDVIMCVYAKSPRCSKKAFSILENLIASTKNPAVLSSLLWTVLRLCTKLCCGCADDASVAVGGKFYEVAVSFSELVRSLLTKLDKLRVDAVMDFVEQEIHSCVASETSTNMFLLLLLQKTHQLQASPRYTSVVQAAVHNMATVSSSYTRVLQLELLKSVCLRLLAERHKPSSDRPAHCTAYLELVNNERLLSDLHDFRACAIDGVSRTTAVLAHNVLEYARLLQLQRTAVIEL